MDALTTFWTAVPWTEVRDWVIGLGTLGTLIVSLVVLLRQGRELEHQASEREERDAFERSAQARMVRLSPLKALPGSGSRFEFDLAYPTVTVTNESDDAIHDVVLGIELDGKDVELSDHTFREPTRLPMLARGSSQTHSIGVFRKWNEVAKEFPPYEVRPFVIFRDMSGHAWRRDHEHRLRLVLTAEQLGGARLRRKRGAGEASTPHL